MLQTTNGGTTIDVYLNNLNSTVFCFDLSIIRNVVVTNLQNGDIIVFDYYDSSEFLFPLIYLSVSIFFSTAKKASTSLVIPGNLPGC